MWYRWLWIPGVIALSLISKSLHENLDSISSLAEANASLYYLIDWGWILLFLGVQLILSAAIVSEDSLKKLIQQLIQHPKLKHQNAENILFAFCLIITVLVTFKVRQLCNESYNIFLTLSEDSVCPRLLFSFLLRYQTITSVISPFKV